MNIPNTAAMSDCLNTVIYIWSVYLRLNLLSFFITLQYNEAI